MIVQLVHRHCALQQDALHGTRTADGVIWQDAIFTWMPCVLDAGARRNIDGAARERRVQPGGNIAYQLDGRLRLVEQQRMNRNTIAVVDMAKTNHAGRR